MAERSFEIPLQESVGEPQHVQQHWITEGIKWNRRSLRNLRVGNLPALKGFAVDSPAQITNTEPALNHIERSRVVGCEWEQFAEVCPTNLLRQ